MGEEEEEEAAVAERLPKDKGARKRVQTQAGRALSKAKKIAGTTVSATGSFKRIATPGAGAAYSVPRDPVPRQLVRTQALIAPKAFECGVYIRTDSPYTAVLILKNLFDFVDNLGFDAWDIVAVEPGSVWTRIKMWGQSVADKRQTRIIASQLVQTAEAMTVDKALSENTERYGTSVAALAEAMQHAESVVLDLGPLQYAQLKDDQGKIHIRSRALGSKDIAAQRLSDDQLKQPQKVFEMLDADSNSLGTN
ncbi:hypothetical protein K0817_013975 [Microbacterium sp. HD4P20]|uniref:hypothetical protein n=1 Tax=Microbacterium sp. HD4P20 TaxID=2864874 RepID=UPI001C63C5FA|nr:hypothetical protein [Microbacterium sp. HD4P20]MCP2637662.1 hypothetical protein [Microbacterium sp. HD4P20]